MKLATVEIPETKGIAPQATKLIKRDERKYAVAEAESAYRKAFGMLPGRMYPLYRLMKLYEAEGQMRKAEEMARQIIAFRPKVDSPAVREMKNEAKKLTKR